MPLIRESDIADPEKLVGVTFAMVDTNQRSKRVICRVTYAALCDRASRDRLGDDWLAAWRSNEQEIERIASDKYDAGVIENGMILIHTLELTPIG